MSKYAATRDRGDSSKWQMALCLLLVALVLYNPYLAAPESSANICFRHAPSNRATVGASELQHFKSANSRSVLGSSAVAVFQYFGDPATRASQSHEYASEAVSFLVQLLSASLWFRPPPSI